MSRAGNLKCQEILRKGAISAKKGEIVVIPINMKDGILVGIGKGNAEWNYSAPHGFGRILKRSKVKNYYTASSYKSVMKGIYSSCIGSTTLDEAPFAYREAAEMISLIGDAVATYLKFHVMEIRLLFI